MKSMVCNMLITNELQTIKLRFNLSMSETDVTTETALAKKSNPGWFKQGNQMARDHRPAAAIMAQFRDYLEEVDPTDPAHKPRLLEAFEGLYMAMKKSKGKDYAACFKELIAHSYGPPPKEINVNQSMQTLRARLLTVYLLHCARVTKETN